MTIGTVVIKVGQIRLQQPLDIGRGDIDGSRKPGLCLLVQALKSQLPELIIVRELDHNVAPRGFESGSRFVAIRLCFQATGPHQREEFEKREQG